MTVYVVTWRQNINHAYVGTMGTYSSREKAEKAIAASPVSSTYTITETRVK